MKVDEYIEKNLSLEDMYTILLEYRQWEKTAIVPEDALLRKVAKESINGYEVQQIIAMDQVVKHVALNLAERYLDLL